MRFTFLTTPVWIGLVLAFVFPYYGLALSRWGFLALFVLSLSNTVVFTFKSYSISRKAWVELLTNVAICYSLLPALQLLLAKLMLHDRSLQLGVLFAAISPVAIVAPQFLKKADWEKNKSVLYVLISTLLYPVLCYAYLKVLKLEGLGIQIWPLIWDVLALTLIPLVISAGFEIFAGGLKHRFLGAFESPSRWLNMMLIGFLVFVYFGSGFAKINQSEITVVSLGGLVAIAIFQDFGTLGLMKILGFSRVEQISFSIKNVALSGGVMLVFHPQATLACSFVFIAHALLFTLLSPKKAAI